MPKQIQRHQAQVYQEMHPRLAAYRQWAKVSLHQRKDSDQ